MNYIIKPNRKRDKLKNIYGYVSILLFWVALFVPIGIILIPIILAACYLLIRGVKELYWNIESLEINNDTFCLQYPYYISKKYVKGKLEELIVIEEKGKLVFIHTTQIRRKVKKRRIANLHLSEITEDELQIILNHIKS